MKKLDGNFTAVPLEEANEILKKNDEKVEASATCYQIRACCNANVGCFGVVIDWDNNLARCRCDTIIA